MDKGKTRKKKLLDLWLPPENAGSAIGCITTTFTFSAGLFEEQCLTNFLEMDSDPNQDGALYLIEREEKMSGLCGVVVMADSRHINEARSLRWDILPARLKGGCQHSKVTLLVWQHYIRIIIASANLTEQAYYKNQEIVAVLDYYDGSIFPKNALQECLAFLSALPGYVSIASDNNAAARWQAVIDSATDISSHWESADNDAGIEIQPVFVLPKEKGLFSQLKEYWNQREGITGISVLSPFFDAEESKAEETVDAMLKLLNARSVERTLDWYTTAEKAPDNDRWLMHIPQASRKLADKKQIKTGYHRIAENVDESGTELYRPLHAKGMWMQSYNWVGYLCGSSNFTQRGTGLSYQPNIEANLLYLFDYHTGGVYKKIKHVWPAAHPVNEAQTGFGDIVPDDSEQQLEQSTLPFGFLDAALIRGEDGKPVLVLKFNKPPSDWKLYFGDDRRRVTSADDWKSDGSPDIWNLSWMYESLPSLLLVELEAGQLCYWPVNVADASLLPPSDDLKNLSLDELIEILSSHSPLRDTMRRLLRRRHKQELTETDEGTADLDPHKRVQTSHHLIRRTQRISRALRGLRNLLQRPVATEEALSWRLHGPIGVQAVVLALQRHAVSDDEIAFLMAELMMDLCRIQYQPHESCLPVEIYYLNLSKVIKNLSTQVCECSNKASDGIRQYCLDVVNHGVMRAERMQA